MSEGLGVYLLDVGQGDASIVLLPDDRAVVFDCRDSLVVGKLLSHWEVEEIAALVISHLDWDHIAGALSLLLERPEQVRRVYLSADRDISEDHDQAKKAKELIDHLTHGARGSDGIPKRWDLIPTCRHPEPIVRGPGWSVHLLAPEHAGVLDQGRTGNWEDPNRRSAVLRVQMAENVVLIGGDAPLATWAEIPQEERRARVFRIPHHGGALDGSVIPDGWSVQHLYQKVNPTEAVISVGTNNPHGHPEPEWVKPITGGACRMLCTQVTERCHPTITGEHDLLRKLVLDELRDYFPEPPWRHLTDTHRNVKSGMKEVPCAGTVVVRIDDNGDVRVSPSAEGKHAEVISLWEQPLCRPLEAEDDL